MIFCLAKLLSLCMVPLHVILKYEVYLMDKSFMIEWLEQGSIALPKLLVRNYKRLGLNETEFMLILQVHTFIESGNHFPTPMEIANNMTISSNQCTEILRQLVKKGFISIEEDYDSNSVICEKYSLRPLWEKLLQWKVNETIAKENAGHEEEETSLYTVFEQEFGRPLSPFECETLAMWIDQDHHDPVIIKAALREAVLSGKLNFRYIDRILFEWKKNGIKTIEQAKSYGKKFRQHQVRPRSDSAEESEYKRTVPFFNWLEQ
jgi:DNA replication protein